MPSADEQIPRQYTPQQQAAASQSRVHHAEYVILKMCGLIDFQKFSGTKFN